ncbi:MAG TPA: A/G-specific adenine glycosylase [Candidatus Paceibacterota bacterium]|nr:A/G-specific adenine glycosylase [Candidatus Paceibacterota bacterium]
MAFYRAHGRHDMPWRNTRDPYRILVSEIMLQQTQVNRVGPFYENFIKQFPDFAALAGARTGDVLRAWKGLGYNRRALALQQLSKVVLEKFNGKLPREREALESLPGIGKGTSGSLMAFAFNRPEIFIETNIRRVFIHHFFPKKKIVTDAEIERCLIRTIDRKNPRKWYWALMDYGTELGRARRSATNPNRRSAHYAKQAKFSGSDRELRGKILGASLGRKEIIPAGVALRFNEPVARVERIMALLTKEGFLKRKMAKGGKNATKGPIYCIKD